MMNTLLILHKNVFSEKFERITCGRFNILNKITFITALLFSVNSIIRTYFSIENMCIYIPICMYVHITSCGARIELDGVHSVYNDSSKILIKVTLCISCLQYNSFRTSSCFSFLGLALVTYFYKLCVNNQAVFACFELPASVA